MGIKWGGIEFEGPFMISEWNPPRKAAVYVIMMKPDPSAKPNAFRSLYFGESGNLSERGFWRAHQKFGCWINKAGSTDNLFIGVCLMPDTTEAQRKKLESELINRYEPQCND